MFLFNGKDFRNDVIEPYLNLLRELLHIMEHQCSYRFYNTSLLLIYEGNDAANGYNTSFSTNFLEEHQQHIADRRKASRANVGVRMIDFAHVQYNNADMNSDLRNAVDESYLIGLRSVIRILEELRSNNSGLLL